MEMYAVPKPPEGGGLGTAYIFEHRYFGGSELKIFDIEIEFHVFLIGRAGQADHSQLMAESKNNLCFEFVVFFCK